MNVPCPQCRAALNGCETVYSSDPQRTPDPELKPEEGEICICLHCGEILVFAAQTLHVADATERTLMFEEGVWDDVIAAQRRARRIARVYHRLKGMRN